MNEEKKRKLIWHCRRGMLELDLLLEAFLAQGVSELSDQELSAFETLLNQTDPQLYSWLMGQEEPSENELKHIVALIRNNH